MQAYIPDPLPLASLNHRQLLPVVGRANAELARYDGLLQALVNPALMLSPLMTQEAVLSSRIEGTQASLDEVLVHEAGRVSEGVKGNDIHEIINYRRALLLAQEYLEELPITLVLIRQMHKVLMDSVRGKEKSPGEFRTDQNWIGSPGSRIEDAVFVPPNPIQLPDHMRDWERYLTYQDIDPLLQTAVVHAQFELLHPFKDGNGRIGRLLIPLFLYQTRALSQPMFYLSEYLEENRDTYYERLRRISAAGEWNEWIEFFLQAIIEQARTNTTKIRSILHLYEELKEQIPQIMNSQYTIRLLDAIFFRPIFSTAGFIEQSGIPRQSALILLRKLREVGVLHQLRPSRGRTPAILAFPDLLGIVER